MHRYCVNVATFLCCDITYFVEVSGVLNNLNIGYPLIL